MSCNVNRLVISTLQQALDTYIELFSGERPSTDACGVSFDNANGASNHLGGYTETSADTANRSRRGSDIRVGSKVKVEHQSIGSFHKNFLPRCDGFVDVGNTVYDIWPQSFCEFLQTSDVGKPDVGGQIYLVSFDLSFCIVLEVAVALIPTFHELSEFLGKGLVVEEVVNA